MRSYVHDWATGRQLTGKATPELANALRNTTVVTAYKNLDGVWFPCVSLNQVEILRAVGFEVKEVWLFHRHSTRWQAKNFGPPYSRFEICLFILMAADVALVAYAITQALN